MNLADTRLALRLRKVPGARRAWRSFNRITRPMFFYCQRWVRRWVRRHPTEVVKSNRKRAFDYFFSQREFIETEYLDEARRQFYGRVASVCVEELGNASARPNAILDVGCGTGHFLLALEARIGERARLCGMDFSTEAIQLAREVVPEAELREANAYALPYPDSTFDLTTCLEMLEHIKRPLDAIAEMLRVTRPGGGLVFTVPDGNQDDWKGHIHFWNQDELAALLKPYGLADVMALPEDAALLAILLKPDVVLPVDSFEQ